MRRIGNSLGVIIPAATLRDWGVGEGGSLNLEAQAIRPPRKRAGAQEALDQLKRAIALEVVRRHPTDAIRRRSLENLERWRKRGTWGPAYEEWMAILQEGDDGALLAAMVGSDERANRLRQSMPFIGMLPEEVSRRLREEASG